MSVAPQSDKLIETLAVSRGKQLRPLFCYSIFNGFGVFTSKANDLAAVFESIHVASLLHDDVIDKCHMRRNLPTMNQVYGDGVAILLGDLVFVSIYQLAANLEEIWLIKDVSQTIRLLVEGELLQQEYRFNENTGKEDYESVIYRKTAALLEFCCYASARFSGQDLAVCESFKAFGRDFGAIFQIVDDWADFCRVGKNDSKDRGVDIANGFITLPWLLLLENCRDEQRQDLLAIIKGGEPAGLSHATVFALANEYDLQSLMNEKLNSYRLKAESVLNNLKNFDGAEMQVYLDYVFAEFERISESL
jgi:geranylgeranyl pyrophosphate synthase